jgi:dihydroneopterin aldolase
VEGAARQLVETVAEDIASQVLRSHGRVQSVTVFVQKPHVALPGVLDTLGPSVVSCVLPHVRCDWREDRRR